MDNAIHLSYNLPSRIKIVNRLLEFILLDPIGPRIIFKVKPRKLHPDNDVEGNSTLNPMFTWYKFNYLIGPFYFEVS